MPHSSEVRRPTPMPDVHLPNRPLRLLPPRADIFGAPMANKPSILGRIDEVGKVLRFPHEEGVHVLNERQRETLKLVGMGFTNNEIGERLQHRSGQTIKHNLEVIFRRLNVEDRLQAVLAAINTGELDLDKIVGDFNFTRFERLNKDEFKLLRDILEKDAFYKEMARNRSRSMSIVGSALVLVYKKLGAKGKEHAAVLFLAYQRQKAVK